MKNPFHTFLKKAVNSAITCSKTHDKSMLSGEVAITANAWTHNSKSVRFQHILPYIKCLLYLLSFLMNAYAAHINTYTHPQTLYYVNDKSYPIKQIQSKMF